MHIAGVGRALPKHYASQQELTAALGQLWQRQPHNSERMRQLHANMAVGGRYTALPLSAYADLNDFTASNDAFIAVGTELAEAAARDALAEARLAPEQVDHLFFVTVTGLSTPSLDARLVGRLGLRPDVRRTPIFGLGCAAGACGTARLYDSLRGSPTEVGLLVSVELCSLTLQRRDLSVTNLVASGLFGDAAAALVLSGPEHACAKAAQARGLPRIVATRSVLYPGTEDLMGWKIGSQGFGIVLSAKVPEVVRHHTRADVDAFLAAQGLTLGDVGTFLLHPGGPKIIDALQGALELSDADVAAGRRNLAEVGNVSSAAVLLMLREKLAAGPAPAGRYGLMMALGPGFCAEMVLLQW